MADWGSCPFLVWEVVRGDRAFPSSPQRIFGGKFVKGGSAHEGRSLALNLWKQLCTWYARLAGLSGATGTGERKIDGMRGDSGAVICPLVCPLVQ